MSLYCMTFGFRQPYQVLGAYLLKLQHGGILMKRALVDSEMCKTATAHKIDFVKQLGIVLQGTVKPSMHVPFNFPVVTQ